LAVVANALTAANWFLFVTGGLVFTLLVIRCGREEENLISRFGDQYRIYMQRTGRFLPRIRRQRRL
jgi:protein-S-isoprenylcysteine O-methyltransferase Ste14